MRVSSYQVLRAAIKHYKCLPTSSMGDFVYTHPSGTTEGVSMILLLSEFDRLLSALEDCEARIRAIGRLLYRPAVALPPSTSGA
jgi:hypothetical protein